VILIEQDKESETIRKKKMEAVKTGEKREAPDVTVYSTPNCPYCTMAKSFFKDKGVAFKDIDVSKDQAKAQEMAMKSQQTAVPVIEINGRIIVGFDRQLIEDSLARRKPMNRDEFLGNVIFDPFGR
jgi:glutaredoxin 3